MTTAEILAAAELEAAFEGTKTGDSLSQSISRNQIRYHIDALQQRITVLEDERNRLPANWWEDSSLATWFPLTAESVERDRRIIEALTEALFDARSIISGYGEGEIMLSLRLRIEAALALAKEAQGE